tara:strand:- start:29986 stop:31575 length:1590 start_codon:yes stop_codon:yes gene_type:complete
MKLLSFISLTFFFFTGVVNAQNSKVGTTLKFDEVITSIERMYVDEVDAVALTNTAIVALLEKLDPHSTFISKEEVNGANERINGNFVGIGIRFQILKDTLMVVATISGGPSEKVGLLAGDKIVTIADSNVAGNGLRNSGVRKRLLGDKGTKVSIQIKRKNVPKLLDFTITRDVIPVHSVDAAYMITDKTGYIKMNTFSRNSLVEVQDGIQKLKKLGMENLIFDLQGNGGGLLYTAKYLADEFLTKDKLVVYSKGRVQPRIDLKTERKGLWEEGRLIVLTDETSASASEILSGAIQDWDRGLVVGRRTFGKGLVQRPIDLSDGSQIRLTIARYYTPSGRFIQKPYDDVEAYHNDLIDRYTHGEYMNQDSIKMPDSLMHKTLIKERTVFGGGGIMPDYFVPLDTTGISDYFTKLVRGGHLNAFTLTYTNKNRKAMQERYPEFADYKKKFKVDQSIINELVAYAQREDSTLVFDEEGYNESEFLLKLRIKAIFAQNLWGFKEFYEVYNESNEILQRAVEIIESKEYSKAGLD